MTEQQPGRRWRLFVAVHPAWALAETALLGLLILWVLSRVVGHVSPSAFSNGTLMLCAACGLWVALRARIPRQSIVVQVLVELATGVALSLLMAAVLPLVTRPLGWAVVWTQSTLGKALTTVLLVLTGPGYLVARIGIRILLFWDQARRRHMVLALTHAHLVVVLVVMGLAILAMTILGFSSGQMGFLQPEGGGWLALFADRLFLTLVPLAGVWTMMVLFVLVALIPPSAIFSFFVARRTTHRLGRLAQTARALRSGDYHVRVDVSGQDEVAQLQADFNAMAEELEHTLHDLEQERDRVARLLAERRELVAAVSHELRTPVTTVRATVESALDRPDGEVGAICEREALRRCRRDLETIEGEVLRLQRLIDDLFTLSQVEVGRLALECRPIDVWPVVERMVQAMAPLAWQADRVQVVAGPAEPLPPANVDESRLEQILANLLRNGVRHTPPGGIVAIMAAVEPEAVRLQVRDTGEGIPAAELDHIWERFFRGDGARQADRRGAGLGLALVKELTEAMGGSVSVESTVGEGSCFTVRLPRI